MDVQLTRDSILVAFHPKNLADNTSMEGFINDHTWNEIKATYYKGIPYLKYPIVSLDALFASIKNLHQYQFVLDCKLYPAAGLDGFSFYSAYSNALIKIIEKYNLQNNVFIESREQDFLLLLQNKKNDYKLFIYPLFFEEGLLIAKKLNLYGISIDCDQINKTQVELAHSKNLKVAVWNIDSKKKNIDAIKKNPDFIQTDELKHLQKLLRKATN